MTFVRSILFVCLGNICRSPLAEAIFRAKAHQAGLDLEVDSAGTGNWHAGELADPRAIAVAKERGYPMPMRSRQVLSEDFQTFDLILAMDRSNRDNLVTWPGSEPQKVELLRRFDPAAHSLDVPDPYYGDLSDFRLVADLITSACDGLIGSLKTKAEGS